MKKIIIILLTSIFILTGCNDTNITSDTPVKALEEENIVLENDDNKLEEENINIQNLIKEISEEIEEKKYSGKFRG